MFKRVHIILGSVSQAARRGGGIPTGFVGMLAICLGLAACGQKGPLYLPDPNTPTKAAKPRPPTPSASNAASGPATTEPAGTKP